MVTIKEGTIIGLNGTNVEIQTDDLIAFKDRANRERLEITNSKELILNGSKI